MLPGLMIVVPTSVYWKAYNNLLVATDGKCADGLLPLKNPVHLSQLFKNYLGLVVLTVPFGDKLDTNGAHCQEKGLLQVQVQVQVHFFQSKYKELLNDGRKR